MNFIESNVTLLTNLDIAYRSLEKARKINILSTLFFILIGLIGNSLIIFVFAQKRFRTNSSNVYLLCLAVNDSLFLLIHFIEDTVKNYQRIFIYDENIYLIDDTNLTITNNNTNNSYKSSSITTLIENIVVSLNITDKYDVACRLINYLRYVLRFISAYIIVAFTIQRLIIVNTPLSKKYISKKSAWITVNLIIILSLLINIWVFFIFELNTEKYYNHCDTNQQWSIQYMMLTIFYVFLIMILPTILIFICNTIITYASYRAATKRKKLKKISCLKKKNFEYFYNTNLASKKHRKKLVNSKSILDNVSTDFIVKPYYLNINHIVKRISRRANSINKLTRMLLLISFSYAFFNLPYFIAWFLFYYYVYLNQTSDETLQNYLIASVKLSEIFYVLNYAINFYIYCASGSVFRNQLKYSIYTNKSNYFKVEYYLEKKGHETNK